MSLQNILEPNNNTLYCKDLQVDKQLLTGSIEFLPTTNQTRLARYWETSGIIALDGFDDPQTAPYSAIIIGKLVTFTIEIPQAAITSGGPSAIQTSALPAVLRPINAQSFSYAAINDVTELIAYGRIYTSGIIAFNGSQSETNFPAGVTAGGNPIGVRAVIHYLLN